MSYARDKRRKTLKQQKKIDEFNAKHLTNMISKEEFSKMYPKYIDVKDKTGIIMMETI